MGGGASKAKAKAQASGGVKGNAAASGARHVVPTPGAVPAPIASAKSLSRFKTDWGSQLQMAGDGAAAAATTTTAPVAAVAVFHKNVVSCFLRWQPRVRI